MGDFVVPYIIIVLAIIIIWILYRRVVRKKHMITALREVVINLFFMYFLAVIYFTFFKNGMLGISFNNYRYLNLVPLRETINMFTSNFMGLGNSLYNVVGNILLFVPLGFFIPLLFKKSEDLKKVLLYGFISSVSIEAIQYFTAINITDIDDVIFNTLGAGLGFICYMVFKKLEVKKIIERVQDKENDKVILLSVKPLGIMLLVTFIITYGMAYKSTYSPNLSDEEMATEAFATYSKGDFVAFKNFDKYKLSLKDERDYLELGVLKKVFNGRYSRAWNSQMHFDGKSFGYEVELIQNYEENEAFVVVFGKNNSSEAVSITFNGDNYIEEVKPNEFFLVVYPEYKKLKEDTDVFNIFQRQESKDLKVEFLNSDGEVNNEIKYLR